MKPPTSWSGGASGKWRAASPVYDRAALKLTDEEKKEFEAQGRKPHWRFLLEQRRTAWDD